MSRRRLEREIVDGFPTLPAGCHVELDRVAAEVVLTNVRQSLNLRWSGLVTEAKALSNPTLTEFLDETGIELEDLYRGTDRGWLALQRASGHAVPPSSPKSDDGPLGRAVARMLHIDDPERLAFLRRALAGDLGQTDDERERRLAAMLHTSLWGSREQFSSVEQTLARVIAQRQRTAELREVAGVLHERIHRVTPPLAGPAPLHVHARYSRHEALSAFGLTKLASEFGSGVRFVPEARADVFFVTLLKTEAHFSPTTMYADHAISPTLIQWESQNATTPESPTGRRYVRHREEGSSVHLFVRESKTADGALGAPPFLYAGPMDYRSHSGERPMRILWELEHALPADIFAVAKVA